MEHNVWRWSYYFPVLWNWLTHKADNNDEKPHFHRDVLLYYKIDNTIKVLCAPNLGNVPYNEVPIVSIAASDTFIAIALLALALPLKKPIGAGHYFMMFITTHPIKPNKCVINCKSAVQSKILFFILISW